MKKFSQISESIEPKPGSYDHFEHHAALFHHHLDNDETDEEAYKHYKVIAKHYGRKLADELHHTENSVSARARTYKNY